jgi:glycosyltransferase involved in cell wall biosynthesis
MREMKCAIFFTRESTNNAHLDRFAATGFDLFDISRYTSSKKNYWMNLVFRGVLSRLISGPQGARIVFNGQSNFAYKLSPWIKRHVVQIELIHSLCSFSYIRMPFLEFYKTSVMISKVRIQDHLALYKTWKVPKFYEDKITYIPNGISLPPRQLEPKPLNGQVRLLFVARNSPEKRFDLALRIFDALLSNGLDVRLGVVGDFDSEGVKRNAERMDYFGQLTDRDEISRVYASYGNVLLLTSTEEGFPLVVMEAMAFGLIVFGTPVGDLPVHVVPGRNGQLFSSINDEQTIVAEAVDFTKRLVSGEMNDAASNSIEYAYEHFAIELFEERYRDLFRKFLTQ